jgi:hypothetical protein
MPNRLIHIVAALALASAVAGCASEPRRPPPHRSGELHGPVLILARFADKEGNVTRAAMEQGLRKDFDTADLGHDGVLQPDEVRPLNDARAVLDSSQPRIIDWNADGVIEFIEFAAAPHALFDQLDRDGDDVLTPDEMESQGAAGPSNGGDQRPRGGPGGGHRGGGRRGGS